MKRTLASLLFVFLTLLVLTCGSAWAENRMINPYYDEAQPPARARIQTYAVGLTPSIECLAEPSFDEAARWRVSVSGAQGDCTYAFYVLDGNWDTCGYSGRQDDPEFSYEFVTPGDYSLYVSVIDSAGNSGTRVADFSLADDGAHPTTESVVASLAAECLAAGCTTDFEKALWMHDWLTKNASYDLSYSYYSADGVLLRGTGVCDSYRKAYELLLHAVGVEAVSATGGNHAWNQVKMNGEWYNVDVTWDDPISSTTEQQPADSGMERHMYFGLPYEIMSIDHTFVTNPKSCTAYEMNYFLYTGKVDIWTRGFVESISSAMENGRFSMALTIPTYYYTENGYYSYGDEHIVYNLAVKDLNRREWMVGDKSLHIHTEYAQGAQSLPVEVLLDPYTLRLPSNTRSIGVEAFLGDTDIMAVDVPAGAALGDRCFAGCTDLWKVVVPDSVTSISGTAFQDSDLVTIVCSEGSYAQQYAVEHGLRVQLQ